MEFTTKIKTRCTIQDNSIVHDGIVLLKTEDHDFSGFSKKAYRHLNIDYPKFFKMDNLSKLAFLGAETILKSENATGVNIALVFANKSSSLDTDVRYNRSISDKDNYFPSPTVFVYTLPNICLGEISIRHQLKSENSFFIFEAFDQGFMESYSKILISTGKAEKVLFGWVEYFEENYLADLFLIEKIQK